MASLDLSRRAVIGGAAALPVAASAAVPVDRIAADLARYSDFGGKASGGAGDTACGAWLEGELAALGMPVVRQAFDIPFFDATATTLSAGAVTATVIAQAPVTATAPGGLTAPLVRVAAGTVPARLDGAIALVELSYRRWSTATAPEVAAAIAHAAAAGAAAVVLVTTGPTGEAIALNVPHDAPPWPCPVAMIGAKDAAALTAAKAPATLRIDGRGGRRRAFNVVGGRVRSGTRALVVSTPRSGWFGCAGERGPGVAIWLALARRHARMTALDPVFVATSGHEYEYRGADVFRDALAPPPPAAAFWLHLGAGIAARDWHELGPRLAPLPSADPQRFLVATPALVPAARRAFAGQPGLEAAYPLSAGLAGELAGIAAAGYAPLAGALGAHRFHHRRDDDARCVDAGHVAAAAAGFAALIDAAIGG